MPKVIQIAVRSLRQRFAQFLASQLSMLVLLGMSFGPHSSVEPKAITTRPNIVLIISDDQSWTDYSFMGHERITTPHLDALAQGGVLFRRAYVPTALCRPSLMTMVTGQYAHRHLVTGNRPAPQKHQGEALKQARELLYAQIDRFDTLPELLSKQGYLTHQSGKWWESRYERGGFSHGMTRGLPNGVFGAGDRGLRIGRNGIRECTKFMDMAIREKQPFFLWFAPFMPHVPHNPPKKYLEPFGDDLPIEVAKYYAMCVWFDAVCGELIDYLDTKKIRENTLVVYIGDNGWKQDPVKEHKFGLRSKHSAYDEGVRQPMIINQPGTLTAQERPELVSSIDIFPTLLAAAGAPQPSEPTPGLSLWQALRNETPIPRETIFGEGFSHDIGDIEQPERSLLYRWCIKGRWKLILSYNGEAFSYAYAHRHDKRPQLFDLLADPTESKNLASLRPEILAALTGEIDGWYELQVAKQLPLQNGGFGDK